MAVRWIKCFQSTCQAWQPDGRRTCRSARQRLSASSTRSRRLSCPTGASSLPVPDVGSSPWFPRGNSRCLTDAVPLLGTKQLLLSFRSGLRRCETIRISIPARFLRLICPLLTSPTRSGSIALPSAIAGTWETSWGKTQNFPCVNARFIKHAPFADGGLRSHVPARPERTTPHIRFLFPGSSPGQACPALLDWASSRTRLTTTPLPFFLRLGSGQALTFGSAITWFGGGGLHPVSSVPCPAHTPN